MSALVSKIYTLGNLVSFSNAGLTIASFVDIKKTLISRFKQLYGDDVDVSDASADGQYITEIALLINSILQTLNNLYSDLDPSVASGKALDVLASFSNISRKPATASTCVVSLRNDGNADVSFTLSVANTKFIDINGLAWSIDKSRPSFIPGYESSVDEYEINIPVGQSKQLALICDEIGPINIQPNTIVGFMTLTTDTSTLTVVQDEAGIVGTPEESDIHLRARRNSSAANEAVTVLESIKGSLLNNENIIDVFINNDTTYHYINVYVRRKYPNTSNTFTDLDDVDDFIGETIYQKLTPGIPAEAGQSDAFHVKRTYEKTIIVNSGVSVNVNWYECRPISDFKIKITLHKQPNCDEFASSTAIKSALLEYVNNLYIKKNMSATKLLQLIFAADPKFQGMPTYYCTPVDIVLIENGSTTENVFTGNIPAFANIDTNNTYYQLEESNIEIVYA